MKLKKKMFSQKLNRFTFTLFSIFIVFFFIWVSLLGVGKYNSNSLLKSFFVDPFRSVHNYKKYLQIFAAFLIASLATLICFRAGFINLNVPGQMAASAVAVFLVGNALNRISPGGLNSASGNRGWIPVLIIVSCLVSMLISCLIAALRVYLDINEIISSLFLNFIIFFLFRAVVRSPTFIEPSSQLQTSPAYELGNSISFNISLFSIVPISFIIAFGIYIFYCFLIKRTRFGFQLRIISSSASTIRFSGISRQRTTIRIFLVSGLLAGLAGLFYYFRDPNLSSLYYEQALPSNGFDAISIIWLASGSLVAVPFFTLLLAIIRVQTTLLPDSQVKRNVMEIIFGLLLLTIAFLNQYYDRMVLTLDRLRSRILLRLARPQKNPAPPPKRVKKA